MTAPREILPGRHYFISRRCTQRQYLLRADAKTNAIFDYCLAEAARRYDIGLIVWTSMSNHYHAVVFDPLGRLPAFLEQFHKMVARALNVRWSRWENLWAAEQACVCYLETLDEILDKVDYVLANPVVDDLVERFVDWPGSTSLGFPLGRVKSIKRPVGFFSPDGTMPEVVELRTVQPPASAQVEDAPAWTARLQTMMRGAEERARASRAKTGKRVLGRKGVLRVSAFDSPDTPAPRRNLRPAIACRDKARRLVLLGALIDFRRRHAAARRQLAAGELAVVFPAGTYQLRRMGITCAPHPRSVFTV